MARRGVHRTSRFPSVTWSTPGPPEVPGRGRHRRWARTSGRYWTSRSSSRMYRAHDGRRKARRTASARRVEWSSKSLPGSTQRRVTGCAQLTGQNMHRPASERVCPSREMKCRSPCATDRTGLAREIDVAAPRQNRSGDHGSNICTRQSVVKRKAHHTLHYTHHNGAARADPPSRIRTIGIVP